MATIGKHAVVLGASIGGAGWPAALADFGDTNTLVERDVLPGRRGPTTGAASGGTMATARSAAGCRR